MSLPTALTSRTLDALAIWANQIRELLTPGDTGAINFVGLTRGGTVTPAVTILTSTPATWAVLADGYVKSEGGATLIEVAPVVVLGAGLTMPPVFYFAPRWSNDRGATWRYGDQAGPVAPTVTGQLRMPTDAEDQRYTQSWQESAMLIAGEWRVQCVGYYAAGGGDPVQVTRTAITVTGNLKKTV